MPRLLLDLKDADLGEPIPGGTYDAQIDTSDCEMKTAKSGDPFIFITYVIEGGEYDGREVDDLYMLAGKGTFKIGRMLRNLGYDVKTEDGEFALNTDDLHGQKVTIEVSVDEERDDNNVDEVMPARDTSATDEYEEL